MPHSFICMIQWVLASMFEGVKVETQYLDYFTSVKLRVSGKIFQAVLSAKLFVELADWRAATLNS